MGLNGETGAFLDRILGHVVSGIVFWAWASMPSDCAKAVNHLEALLKCSQPLFTKQI